MATEVVSASRAPVPQQGPGLPGRGQPPGAAFEQMVRSTQTPAAPAAGVSALTGRAAVPSVTLPPAGLATQPGQVQSAQAPLGQAQPGQADDGEQAGVDRDMLERAVASVKEYIKVVDRQLDFEVDETTGRTLVRVVDPESGDVIRQVPPETVMNVAKALAELSADSSGGSLSGLLFEGEA